MANNYFSFKKFTINQERAAFKVGTDGVLLGAGAGISGVKRILDIGTGTGLISLMLAQRCSAEIVAIEPDIESYLQAKENVLCSGWASRITVLNVRLQDLSPDTGTFDLIVSNPPYFIDSLKNPDPVKSSARHNCNLTQEELLQSVSALLGEDGRLEVILPYAEGNIFIAEAGNYSLYCNSILKIKPLPSSEIRRLILSFSRKRVKVAEKFLTIERGSRHDFTEEYISLTKDFYLNF